MPVINPSIIGLDVGGARIGIAVASLAARLPHPLVAMPNNETFFDKIVELIERESANGIVVGLPRNLGGEATKQTETVMAFADQLAQRTQLPLYFQDEALTSVKAEAELRANFKNYQKADIDSLAAVYILEDYLAQGETGSS